MQYLKKLEEEQGLKPEDLLELSLTLQPEPLQLTEATQGEFPSDQSQTSSLGPRK